MHEQRLTKWRKTGRDPAYPRLLGERLCLNFANTVDGRASEAPEEFLHDSDDLIRWGWHVGLLDEDQAERLLAVARSHPDEATRTFTSAITLREAVFRVFSAVASGSPPPESDLAEVQEFYRDGLANAQLTPEGEGFSWVWRKEEHLERVPWEVARSAVELLTAGDLVRVKQCAELHGGCRGLFYDLSKNGSRRWCSMEGCGSHAKMRRYNARKRTARQ